MPSTASKRTKRPADTSRWPWLLVVFLAGAGAMIIEVTAPRMLQPYFGASTFVWTNVIGVVLLAMALGYRLGGHLADRKAASSIIGTMLALAGALALMQAFLVKPISLWLLPDPATLARMPTAYQQVRTGSLLVSAAVFAPPVFLLATISPQVIRVLVSQNLPIGRAAGSVFMWGTIGSLLGTFLPTYLLVPTLGSRQTLIVAATLLATPGAILILRERVRPAVAAGCVVLIAVLGATAYGAISQVPIRSPQEGQVVLVEEESTYQYLRVVRQPDWENAEHSMLVLHVNEGVYEIQSMLREGQLATGTFLDVMATLPAMFERTRPLSALVLGSGAGTLSRLLLNHWPGQIRRIVNVELDPAVQALEPMFDYRPPRESDSYASHVMDGRTFLSVNQERFDLVFMDIYTRQSDIPYHVATAEFFAQVWQALRPGGIVAINVNTFNLPNEVTQGLARAMGQDERPIMSTPGPLGRNTVLWARNSDEALQFAPLQPIPEAMSKAVRHARRFSTIVEVSEEAPRFTDNYAPVEYLGRRTIDRD